MNEIFRTYVRRFEEDFRRIELFSSAAKNRLLIDVQFLIAELSNLDNVDGPGNHLEVCINNIKIKDKRSYSRSPSISFPHVNKLPVTPTPPAKKNLSVFANNFGKILRSQDSPL